MGDFPGRSDSRPDDRSFEGPNDYGLVQIAQARSPQPSEVHILRRRGQVKALRIAVTSESSLWSNRTRGGTTNIVKGTQPYRLRRIDGPRATTTRAMRSDTRVGWLGIRESVPDLGGPRLRPSHAE